MQKTNGSTSKRNPEQPVAGEWRQEDEPLRESEARFRSIFDQSAVAMSIIGLDGKWIRLNEAYPKMFGYTLDELMQLDFTRLTHPEDRAADTEGIAKLLAGELESYIREKRYIHKNGSIIWGILNVTAPRSPSGEPSYLVAVIQDITPHKQAEAEAKLAQERLHNSFVQAPAAVAVFRGPTHVYEIANLRYMQLIGQQRDVIGKPIREALPELEGQGVYELLDNVHTSGKPFVGDEFPAQLDRADNGQSAEGYFNFVYQPLRNAEGAVEGIFVHAVEVTAQVKARQRLAESEARWRFMADAMPQKILTARPNGDIDYFNPQWGDFTGLSFEEIRDWGWTQFIHPEDVAENVRSWQHSIDTGEPFQLEHRFRRADGVYHWHLSRAVPMRDDRDNIVMWVGSNTDIDDVKQAQKALEYQSQVTQTITDNAALALLMSDAQHRCTFMNPAAEKMTGFTFAEVQAQDRPLHEIIHHTKPDGTLYPMSECPIDKALPQNRQTQGEDVFVRKDGTFYPVAFTASPIREGEKPVGTVIEVQDISERKRVEAERARLLKAEQWRAAQVRALADAAVAINSSLSTDDILQAITQQARDIIGAHRAVTSLAVDQNWAQAINSVSLSDKHADSCDYQEPPDGWGIYALVCRTNMPLRLTQAELEAHPAWRGSEKEAGKRPPMRGWLAAPLIGRDSRNLGLIQLSDKYEGEFTAQDESILVQLAQTASVAIENARLYHEAQEAVRARDRFLSVASHELKTPVTSIKGYSQLLSRQAELTASERVARGLKSITSQADRLSTLISVLLDVSRIESGQLQLVQEPVDLVEFTQEVVAQAQLLSYKHPISVHSGPRSDAQSWIVLADHERLRQVLVNLLENAIKYSPEGGPIDVTLSHEWERVVVSVRDRGIGIPSEQLHQVFERFYRAPNASTRNYSGLGLGLHISREIVQRHGGETWVESQTDQGSTFSFSIPLS